MGSMKKYLFKKYIIYSLIISLFILIASYSFGLSNSYISMIFQSFFIGGTLGVLFINKYFTYLNYWVLFSNLRINKYLYLGLFYCSYQLSLLILVFTIGSNINGL